jgi:hypothetical protein
MCCLLKGNQCFGGTFRLHLQGRRINQARNQRGTSMPSTLNIEAAPFSEISVYFQVTKRRYIPEDKIVQGIDCYCFPVSTKYNFSTIRIADMSSKSLRYSLKNVTEILKLSDWLHGAKMQSCKSLIRWRNYLI